MSMLGSVIGELTTTGRFIPYLVPKECEFHEQKQFVGMVYDGYDPGFNARESERRRRAEWMRRKEAEIFGGPQARSSFWEDLRRREERDDKVDTSAYEWREKSPEEIVADVREVIEKHLNGAYKFDSYADFCGSDPDLEAAAKKIKVLKDDEEPKPNEPWYQKFDKKRTTKRGRR